ncbi:hypothetical protein LMH87_012133 [Akanthomyces muscarius]|uniref:Uncharacterized protein n=1 Tax=Akanthomyces muscarius TaxID=2231603 RepID=A0A9W8UKL8_AKAMU|nr:hypothetical protein LMH87_012133 [Akanthomyces muscarius]KAJ4151432.1 hypothetical protein LMH87_012133 [Akanthomyces muscarius]
MSFVRDSYPLFLELDESREDTHLRLHYLSLICRQPDSLVGAVLRRAMLSTAASRRCDPPLCLIASPVL